MNVRDWLYVEDHCKAIDLIIHKGRKTIQWYLDNREWWETIISGEYQSYYEKMYGNREQKELTAV